MFKIKKRLTILIIIYIVMTVLYVLLSNNFENFGNNFWFLGVYTIIHIIISFSIMYIRKREKFIFSNIFITLLYIFHVGQILLKFIINDYNFSKFDLYSIIGNNSFVETGCYSLYIITFIVVGISLVEQGGKSGTLIGKAAHSDIKKMKMLGYIILFITLPINFKISLDKIILSNIGTYLDSFRLEATGVTSFIGSCLIIGITMLMLCYHNDKGKLSYVYILSIIFYMWTMISGGRGNAVISIIYLTFIYFKFVKISFGKIMLFLFSAYVGISFLNAIASIRDFGGISINKIMDEAQGIENPILKTIEEFGSTQYTVALAMNKVPQHENFKNGSTYFKAIPSLLPNIGGIFTTVNNEANFVKQLGVSYIGGSIIGEIYYNFGYSGFLIALMIGFVVGKCSKKIELIFSEKNYFNFAYFTMFYISSLWWIRDTFLTICRNTLWSICIVYFLSKVYDFYVNKKRGE